MHDYKYAALTITDTYKNLASRISHEPLKPIAEAFEQNMERVRWLADMPAYLVSWATSMEAAYSTLLSRRAAIEKLAASALDGVSTLDVQALVDAENTTVLKAWAQNCRDALRKPPGWIMSQGAPRLNLFLDVFPELGLGIDAIFSGTVVGTWTAVEVFAEDLWTCYVNAKPETALARIAKPGKLRFMPEAKCLELVIPWEEFRNSGFSLQGRFADMIKSDHAFDSFERIARAYGAAFDAPLECLDTDRNRGLFNLAKTRNVIVHNSGIADEPFMHSMVTTKSPLAVPEFRGLQKGRIVPLDGPIVSSLICGAVSSATSMLAHVGGLL
jgi:hypothetical protein